MKEIQSENLLQEIENLNNENTIFINVDKDICNRIKLLNFKIDSYNNLFNSYINNTIEEANEFNLSKFTDLYSKLYVDKQELITNTIVSSIGTLVYNYIIKNKIKCFIDIDIDKIRIMK